MACVAVIVEGIAIAGDPVAGAVPSDIIELCDLGVSPAVAQANMTFYVSYALNIDATGAPSRIDLVKNEWVSDSLVRACLAKWRLPVRNTRFSAMFVWEHGSGWVSIRLSADGLNRTIRIAPAFHAYPRSR